MSHQGSDGQQTFSQRDGQQRTYNMSSTNGVTIKQQPNLMVNPSIGIPQNNIMQNSAVALGIVQQQPQIPMLWKGQAPLVPNPGTTVSASNNQNQLSGPFASIVPSNGMIPLKTQVEPSPPNAPGSAPNIILAPEPIKNSDKTNRSSGRKAPTAATSKAAKATKGSHIGTKGQNRDQNDIDGKTEKNRERNREHARSTRLRKKAYIQKLKDMAQGLRAVQTKEIRERRLSMESMMNIQKVRRAVVQTVLDYHAGNEKDPSKWNVLLESSFWMKQPVTPFRSFRRSEIDKDCRILRGTDSMICDAASIAVMVERIGCHNARWRRIKRSDFLNNVDDRDTLIQEIGITQQPESSLSSESSSDSSQCSERKNSLKRKRSSQNIEGSSSAPKVSSSSESVQSTEKHTRSSSDAKTNAFSSDENDKEISAKFTIPQPKVGRIDNATRQPPVLSRAYLNKVSAEPISAFYAVNQDDMIVLEDVLMCPYVFRTKNAVPCGALADCVIPGMLRANFSKNNKLLSMELVFDAMGFMQQLDSSNGDESNSQAIPNSDETAFLPCQNEARVITEARPPYAVVHVNEPWTRLTKYSQVDAEGVPLFSLLQRESIDSAGIESDNNPSSRSGRLSHSLDDVQSGRPACSTSVHYNKDGEPFVDFMSSYPLSFGNDQITHLLHVNMELPQTVALISS